MSEATGVDGASRNGVSDDVSETDLTRAELLGEVQLLAQENQRLRAQRETRVRQSYRRAAIGFFILGVLSAGAGFAVPESQTILFSLAGVGFFSAVLTFWLTPSQVISAPVGDRVYSAYAAMGQALLDDLGLQETYIYLPAPTHQVDAVDVRLFIPQSAQFVLPKQSELESLFVVESDDRSRGVSIVPTGASLVAEFEYGQVERAGNVEELAGALADALVEGFELVDRATATVDPNGGAITIGIRGSSFGDVDRFDHPVGSFVASALAAELDAPIRMEIRPADQRGAEFIVDCQ